MFYVAIYSSGGCLYTPSDYIRVLISVYAYADIHLSFAPFASSLAAPSLITYSNSLAPARVPRDPDTWVLDDDEQETGCLGWTGR